jgi:parvulin-like peptidyl-prolyl isomerase
VLAVVGDIEIGSNEWQIIAARKTPADGKSLSQEERHDLLNELIKQKLLYLHAKKTGIDRNPKVQKLMVQTLMREEVYSTVRNSDFSPEQLQAYFEAHHEDFVVPEKVQVRRIFVKSSGTRTLEEAKTLISGLRTQLIEAPDSFKTLAKDNSEDPYRKRGGDLGFVAREGKPGVPEEVTKRAFDMEVGALSDVFEAGGGFNIISVVNRRERVERTFEQMKGSVLRKMKAEKFRDLFDSYVDGIRGDYTVVKNPELLDGIEVKAPHRFSMGSGPGADGRIKQLAPPASLPRKK